MTPIEKMTARRMKQRSFDNGNNGVIETSSTSRKGSVTRDEERSRPASLSTASSIDSDSMDIRAEIEMEGMKTVGFSNYGVNIASDGKTPYSAVNSGSPLGYFWMILENPRFD
jgi:hypothetical protein